jgi:hypothetical protein
MATIRERCMACANQTMKRRPYEDLTGRTFGRLTVSEDSGIRKKDRYWRCLCLCGKETLVRASDLIRGKTRSCGCLGFRDLTEQTFGRLTATNRWQSRQVGKRTRTYWLCVCSCGNESWIQSSGLTSGYTTSCGCFSREVWRRIGHSALRHGHNKKALPKIYIPPTTTGSFWFHQAGWWQGGLFQNPPRPEPLPLALCASELALVGSP